MSASMNKVILIGNLGTDPEIKMTATGTPVCRFSLATTENWKNQAGEKQSKTEWHTIVVWGKQAEIAEKYLRKGKQVMIEGRIQYRDYTDAQGIKKTICDIRCDNFVMLGRMDDGAPRNDAMKGGSDYEDTAAPVPPSASAYPNEDIPF